MFGLPKSSEVSKQLPKKAIYEKFNMNTAAKDRFDADISRITIVNEISPVTVAVAAGEEVKSFYVLLVSLKRRDCDERIIGQLSRLIGQNMLFVLEYGKEARLSVFRGKVISTPWRQTDDITVTLKGLDLDEVWQNIIVQIGDIEIRSGNSLDEQIAIDEKRAKLQKEIDKLEKIARAEKQPKKKIELLMQINKLKHQYAEIIWV
ncbi:MAG: DUF4391 domain-containing protein [Clostridia bacterium]|nr:DUF4391 domain-containing protein [Clostridia bacterium]